MPQLDKFLRNEVDSQFKSWKIFLKMIFVAFWQIVNGFIVKLKPSWEKKKVKLRISRAEWDIYFLVLLVIKKIPTTLKVSK